MSRLSDLAQKIKALPELNAERDRLTIVRIVRENAESSYKKWALVRKQAPHIEALAKRAGLVEAIDQSVTKAVAQAKNLKKLIERSNFGLEQNISDRLEDLRENVSTVERRKTEAWTRVQSEIQPFETILTIAKSLRLDSVPNIQAAVDNFKKVTSTPPSNREETDRVIAAVEGCRNAMVNSGLTGNVKIILEKAIEGNGDPKLLLEEDVQAFLKKHPALWGTLRLKLAYS